MSRTRRRTSGKESNFKGYYSGGWHTHNGVEHLKWTRGKTDRSLITEDHPDFEISAIVQKRKFHSDSWYKTNFGSAPCEYRKIRHKQLRCNNRVLLKMGMWDDRRFKHKAHCVGWDYW